MSVSKSLTRSEDPASAHTAVAFRCDSSTPITTTGRIGNIGAASTNLDVVITGEGRTIIFECTGSCNATGLDIRSDKVTMKHFTMKGWETAIDISGDTVTLDTMVFDDFDTRGVFLGNNVTEALIKNSTFKNATGVNDTGIGTSQTNEFKETPDCDELGALSNEDVIFHSGTPRSCYNLSIVDTVFDDVDIPVDLDTEGRFYISGGTMSGTGMEGPKFGHDSGSQTTLVRIEDGTYSGMFAGMRMLGDLVTKHNLEGVAVSGNTDQGIVADSAGNTKIRNSVVISNGGSSNNNLYSTFGGVVSDDSNCDIDAEVNNVICCNVDEVTPTPNANNTEGNVTATGSVYKTTGTGDEVCDQCDDCGIGCPPPPP